MRKIFIGKCLTLFLLMVLQTQISSCGKAPNSILRQGQLPITDFPLYVTLGGSSGTVRKYERDGSFTVFASDLNNPLGIATDRYRNIWVVENGSNSLIKFKENGERAATYTGFSNPFVVAVDSFDQAFVTQDGNLDVVRAADKAVFRTFTTLPSALAFGVSDIMLIGLLDANEAYWGSGSSAPKTTVNRPTNIAVDMSGRVYVADQGSNDPNVADGRVLRYHQTGPYGGEIVADQITSPTGIAIDAAENIFVVENSGGVGRIVLAYHDASLYIWVTGLTDPQYLSFTRY